MAAIKDSVASRSCLLSMIDEEQCNRSYLQPPGQTPKKNKRKLSAETESWYSGLTMNLVDSELCKTLLNSLRNGFALSCIISVGFTSFLAMDMQAGLETQFLSETGMNLTHSTFMDF